MTREGAKAKEVLEIIKQAISDTPAADSEKLIIYDALDTAMQALELEPCEDCIRRQAVLDINESHHGQMPNRINHQIWQEIKDLPSVQPKTDILDKIRAELLLMECMEDAVEVIDKYRQEG